MARGVLDEPACEHGGGVHVDEVQAAKRRPKLGRPHLGFHRQEVVFEFPAGCPHEPGEDVVESLPLRWTQSARARRAGPLGRNPPPTSVLLTTHETTSQDPISARYDRVRRETRTPGVPGVDLNPVPSFTYERPRS